MHDRDAALAETFARLGGNPLELRNRHSLVRFIRKSRNRAAVVRTLPHDTQKRYYPAASIAPHRALQLRNVDGLRGYFEHLSAAHRRQQGKLVSVSEPLAGIAHDAAVARDARGRRERCDGPVAVRKRVPHVGDRRAFLALQILRGRAEELPHARERKDADFHARARRDPWYSRGPRATCARARAALSCPTGCRSVCASAPPKSADPCCRRRRESGSARARTRAGLPNRLR